MGLPRTKAPHCWLAFAGMLIKGELISKGPFGILNFSKKRTKTIRPVVLPIVPLGHCFSLFLFVFRKI